MMHLLRMAMLAAALNTPLSAKPQQMTTPIRPAGTPASLIDINHASADELLKVPGMTRSWAGRIVRFRPYRAKTDLVERGVLPNDIYARVKIYIIAHRNKE